MDHVEELPDDVLLLVMGLLDLRSRIRVERGESPGVAQRAALFATRARPSRLPPAVGSGRADEERAVHTLATAYGHLPRDPFIPLATRERTIYIG